MGEEWEKKVILWEREAKRMPVKPFAMDLSSFFLTRTGRGLNQDCGTIYTSAIYLIKKIEC